MYSASAVTGTKISRQFHPLKNGLLWITIIAWWKSSTFFYKKNSIRLIHRNFLKKPLIWFDHPSFSIFLVNREVVLITAILQCWLIRNQHSSGIWRHSADYSDENTVISTVTSDKSTRKTILSDENTPIKRHISSQFLPINQESACWSCNYRLITSHVPKERKNLPECVARGQISFFLYMIPG